MAKNLFNICNVTMPDDDEHEPFFDIKNMPKRMFTMRELSELAQYTELDLKHRWFIIGDVDVSGLITKNEKIDDSFFPYLIVHGDFKCSKYSQTFPRIIDGCFDCSDCGKDYINQGTFFPVLAKKVNCAYSVRDFDILMGILPNNIETLVVEPKLIKKSYLLKDEKHLKNVLGFIQMYPNLTVIDTDKNNLMDILRKIVVELDSKKNQINETEKKVEETKKQILPKKIDGVHLGKHEIFKICRKKQEFAFLSNKELKRSIGIVLSDSRLNGIEKKEMMRADGVPVVCIHVNDLPLVYSDLQLLIQERKEAKAKEKEIVKKTYSQEPEEVVYGPVIQPIKIKKYITFGQYKDVLASSGFLRAQDMLRNISDINVSPFDMKLLTQRSQGRLFILQDGKLIQSDMVKKKKGCCIVQSIDSSLGDDNKRLVWRVADGPEGLIFVCIKYFPDHDKPKVRNIYNETCDSIAGKVRYTERDLADYFDVDDMLGIGDGGGKPGEKSIKNESRSGLGGEYREIQDIESGQNIMNDLLWDKIHNLFNR